LAYCNRGWVYYAKQKNDLAMADFKKTIELTKDPALRQAAEQGVKFIEGKS